MRPTVAPIRHSRIPLLLLTLALLVLTGGVQAATFTVTRTDDRNAVCAAGDCSLREAATLANATAGDDTIAFNIAASPATITLTAGAIPITSNIAITGPGLDSYPLTSNLTIDANSTGRIFSVVGSGLTVSIGGLGMTRGNGGGVAGDGTGGAIFQQGVGSTLTLDRVKVFTNHTGASNDGGAVFTQFGSLVVIDSTFNNNTATVSGGAISFEGPSLKVSGSTFNNNAAQGSSDFGGGAIYTQADATVIANSTLSGNTTAYGGGGVYAYLAGAHTLVIRNSTITGNTAQFGGGVFHSGGTTTLANDIIALNTATGLPSSNNIYTDPSSTTLNQTTNYTGATPMLGPLANNGGPTQTHALLAGSPAIDSGTNAQALGTNGTPLTTDQRGPLSPRITDGTVDIGSYEFGSLPTTSFTVTRTDDRNVACAVGDCSLREAVTAANAAGGAQLVDFASALSGQTITLTGGDVDITDSVIIDGLGQNHLTVTANNTGRVFVISGAPDVTISGLTITGGNGGGVLGDGHGGAIFQQGVGSKLTLLTVRITANHTGANNDGGGVFTQFGSLVVRDSTFSSNIATRSGGGISFEGPSLIVTGSTFNNNAAQGTADNGGGAIFTQADATSVINSTLSANTTGYGGGGIYAYLAGAHTLTVRNSTLTANSAQFGGGVFHSGGSLTLLANDIIALNTATTIPSSNNIYSDGTLSETTNYKGTTPLIGPLADNGGPTQTHALLCASPAYNAGTNAQALDENGAALSNDQRGLPRPVGTVDIGSYEAQVVPPCTPSLSIDDVTLAEGNAGTTNFVFTVTLSAASASTVTVDYTTGGGTALAGTDYTTTSGTLTFLAGELSKPITVPVAGDTLTEPDETFFVNLTNPSNATILDGQGLGTITNDDLPPAISIADVTLAEGNGGTTNFVFDVTLSGPSASTITVDFATADGTATAGSDYGAGSGTVTFNPGVTAQQVTVPVTGDTLFEANETFFVNLTNPSNATINDGQGLGTITNDDLPPSISIADVTLAEGNAGTTNFVFNVTLSAPSGAPVTVDFATAPGTATAGVDYTASSGTLTFNPGVTLQQITIAVAGETAIEPNETFFVNLTNAAGANVNDGQGLGTIVNDDGAPAISIGDVTLVEGNAGTTNFLFNVTLSAPSASPVTVDFATADGTATAGTDYTAMSGTLTFNPTVVLQQIIVPVLGDLTLEPTETFFVNLTNPSGALITDNQGLGTITTDDVAVADVSIVKAAPAMAGHGASISYLMTVANGGPQSASSVAVTDLLPAGTTFQSATASQGSCSGTTTVTCNLGTIASGSSATVTLVVIAPAVDATVSNTATVTAAESDPNPGNNTSTSLTTVVPVVAIPMASEWALLVLALTLAALGLARMR